MKFKTVKNKGKSSAGVNLAVKLPVDYPWKVLRWLVQDLAHLLTEDECLLLDQIVRDRDSFALSILTEEWGLQRLNLESELSLAQLRAKYQICALLKKYRFPSDRNERIDSAIQKFIKAEDLCAAYNHGGYKKLLWGDTEHDAELLTYVRSFLKKLLGEVTPTNSLMTEWSRHGPGSNLDTCKGAISQYDKYANWPYSCTSLALPYARFLIQSDDRWLGALEDSYRDRFNIPKHRILNQRVFWDTVLKVVPGNRITFVPKDASSERSIAIEPTMNLMLQLGVDGHIRRRLKRWGVDLDSQEKNQLLAKQGSLDPSKNSFVTMDLSMASDSLSLALCKNVLPPDWYDYLFKLRSPSGVLGKDIYHYEKISSMGNGYTFALESAIFTAILYAVHKADNPKFSPHTEFAVFGDDLICRQRLASQVVDLLGKSGFMINTEKSFFKGPIRESCGADWFKGKLIRPVFFDETPSDVMDLLVDINRLKRLLSLRWGLEESLTIAKMSKWIPEFFRVFTGPPSNIEFDSYIHDYDPLGHGYKNGMWKYRRLIKKPVQRTVRGFLMRKLMHSLKPHPLPPGYIKRKRLSASGSRFTVMKSYSSTAGTTLAWSEQWPRKYTEVVS